MELSLDIGVSKKPSIYADLRHFQKSFDNKLITVA